MDTLRDVSISFFRLSLSQKSAIAGKLELLEDDDAGQPDFERFRRVLIRARDQELIGELDREINSIAVKLATNKINGLATISCKISSSFSRTASVFLALGIRGGPNFRSVPK